MVNTTHLKVLLTKDYLTLRRNVGFIIAFLLLPIALMVAFISIQQLVDKGEKSGSLVDENFFYTSTHFIHNETTKQTYNFPFMDIPPIDIQNFQFRASSLMKCTQQNPSKYYFSKVAIVAQDATLRANLVEYFEKYVFKQNAYFDNFTVGAYETQDDAFAAYKKDEKQPFCFGLTFNKFDIATDQYEVEFHF